jgi:hypothetical protein
MCECGPLTANRFNGKRKRNRALFQNVVIVEGLTIMGDISGGVNSPDGVTVNARDTALSDKGRFVSQYVRKAGEKETFVQRDTSV